MYIYTYILRQYCFAEDSQFVLIIQWNVCAVDAAVSTFVCIAHRYTTKCQYISLFFRIRGKLKRIVIEAHNAPCIHIQTEINIYSPCYLGITTKQ